MANDSTGGLPGRRGTSWLVKGYGILGAGLIAGYLWVALSGWELRLAPRGVLPASVRTSPGGYRSFHFWHGGFHGGK